MKTDKMIAADLFSFYGELLTDKQKDVLTLYCLEDLSLAEVAEDLKISRQGVHDAVKRGIKLLEGYEARLKLMEKFQTNNRLINDVHKKMIELKEVLLNTSTQPEILKTKVGEVVNIVLHDINAIIE